MRVVLLLAAVLLSVPEAGAGPLLVTHPAERLQGSAFELEYLRPWGDLPVQQGRAAAGVRLPVVGRIGAVIEGLQTPTVQEIAWGLWIRPGPWMRAEFLTQDAQVEGFGPARQSRAELDLALQRPRWAAGVGLRLLQDEQRVLFRRNAWVSCRTAGTVVFVGRSSQPFTGQPVFSAGMVWRVFGRVRVGAQWRQQAVEFSFGWGGAGLEVTSSSVWSGPQTGAFGFRVAGPP